jgi:hypothetical protein
VPPLVRAADLKPVAFVRVSHKRRTRLLLL